MQFNLVNDQEQVAQFVRRGVALCCMALALQLLVLRWGRVPAALVAWVCISPLGAFAGLVWAVLVVSGSFAY